MFYSSDWVKVISSHFNTGSLSLSDLQSRTKFHEYLTIRCQIIAENDVIQRDVRLPS